MSHAATTSFRRARSVSRGRHLSPLEWALLGVLALALVAAAASSTGSGTRSLATSNVRVHVGDTPWSIAQTHPVDGLTTAQTADLIVEMNGIDGSYLVAGDAILVPSGGPHAAVAMR